MASGIGAERERARVLETFVRDGRIVAIPTKQAKRDVLLDLLAQQFEPGRHYTELEVNEILRAWHDDHAAWRRYLVDGEYLDRSAGVYWRAGGTFAVDDEESAP